jgi:uncharacterized membrane protein
MPVCARCSGLYIAGAAGLVSAWALRRRAAGTGTRVVLGLAAAPILASVALEWMGLIHTSNVVRLLTGLPLGFVAGLILVRSLNQSEAGGPRGRGVHAL